MKFNELSPKAKLHALLWYNSEYDAYGVNGTGEYGPCTESGLENIAETNGWEFDGNGDRKNY